MIRRTALTLALAVAALGVVPSGADASQPLNQAGLDGLGGCEADTSGGYSANTGNGYFGRYQFLPSTWVSVVESMVAAGAVGPDWLYWASVLPHEAPPEVQDAVTVWLWNTDGSHHWPVCQHSAIAAMGAAPPPEPSPVEQIEVEAPTPSFLG